MTLLSSLSGFVSFSGCPCRILHRCLPLLLPASDAGCFWLPMLLTVTLLTHFLSISVCLSDPSAYLMVCLILRITKSTAAGCMFSLLRETLLFQVLSHTITDQLACCGILDDNLFNLSHSEHCKSHAASACCKLNTDCASGTCRSTVSTELTLLQVLRGC